MIGIDYVPPPVRPPARDKPRDYLSYSAISTYQSCPLKFFFRYVAGLPERTISMNLVFGRAVHQAVEYYFNELLVGNEPPPLAALVGEYDRHWQEVDPKFVRFNKDDDVESLSGLAERMLSVFRGSALARPDGAILGVEEELRGAVVPGCPDLLGRLDLLIETKDALVVTDLKTARSRWSPEQVEDSAGQLLLYSELVRGIAPRKRLRLQFAVVTKAKLPSVDLHEVPVDKKRIDRTKRIVERVSRAIERQSYYPAPSAMNCSGCPFRVPCRAWGG